MIAINATTSIKTALIWLVMLVCSITLTITLVVTSYFDYQRQQQQLQTQFTALLNILAINVQSSLLSNNKFREEQRLSGLSAMPIIKNVHIYQWQAEQATLEFFASYNKADAGPWPQQQQRLAALTEPVIDDDIIEQSKVVHADGQLLGYVYLRGSRQALQASQRQQTLFNVFIAFAALLLSLLLTLKLQQRFSHPIKTLLELVSQVARSKDYRVRAPVAELAEFNLLNRAFNAMMDRIESHIHKQEQAEQEIKQLNSNLEQKITARTQALREANQELLNTLATLHKYQNQIIETEKMASLGQMVAGIAHEVNTPLGLGITASTIMQDRMQEIEQAFVDKKLTASQFSHYLQETKENLSIIYRNLERAAGLISSFKQVAVDQTNETKRQFNLRQLIQEVILSLRPNLKQTPHQIALDCAEDLLIVSKPGHLNQILINLIMNSLIHAFDDNQAGTISIAVKLTQQRCFLSYRDNGKGVPEHIRKRIFDPFVTTKRGTGGSGLGLHLVYNLVTQSLNGNISLESSLGNGITIEIDFPVS